MTAFNALMDSSLLAPEPAPPPGPDQGTATGPAHMGIHIADLQGTPPLRGDHNIPLHVGFLGILALGVVVVLRLLGFRFSAVGQIATGVGR